MERTVPETYDASGLGERVMEAAAELRCAIAPGYSVNAPATRRKQMKESSFRFNPQALGETPGSSAGI